MPNLIKRSVCQSHKKGAILFVALWALLLLIILGVAISSRVSSEITVVKFLERRLIRQYLGKAALERAKAELVKNPEPGANSYSVLAKERNYTLGNAEITYSMIDEESFINVNAVGADVLKLLPGMIPDLNPDLAENVYKSDLKTFSVKEELLLVKDMTQEAYDQFKDLITVYSDEANAQVNINTASKEVLDVLGLGPVAAEDVVKYRDIFCKGDDGEYFNENDKVIQDPHGDLSLAGLGSESLAELDKLIGKNLIGVNSRNVRLNVTAKLLGNVIGNYTIIFDRQGGLVKSWQEN